MNLDSQFATANITQSLTKFHWAVAKLPFSLSPTIQPLADDPTAVADPYGMLKELLLESYGLTEEQKTSRWLDYPMCGSETRPSVLWDNLTALRPKTPEEAQIALFIRKLPRHSSAMINTKSFDTPKDMIRRCNQLWATQTPEEAAAASAAAAAATAGPHRVSPPTSGRQQRHLAFISEYTNQLRYLPGTTNVVADALSRPAERSGSVQPSPTRRPWTSRTWLSARSFAHRYKLSAPARGCASSPRRSATLTSWATHPPELFARWYPETSGIRFLNTWRKSFL